MLHALQGVQYGLDDLRHGFPVVICRQEGKRRTVQMF